MQTDFICKSFSIEALCLSIVDFQILVYLSDRGLPIFIGYWLSTTTTMKDDNTFPIYIVER